MSILNLVFDSDIFVERKLARQGHVDDDPRGPHVQGAVEALLTQDVGVEHLGGQIGRGSND